MKRLANFTKAAAITFGVAVAALACAFAAHAQPSYILARSINIDVNRSTTYRTDLDLYGRPDFWTIANGAGDCEDFALAKRQRFIDAGFGDFVRLATAWVPREGYHAVLIVTTTRGDYVLDNMHPLPMRRQELPWVWDKIQQGSQWRAILQ
jgi:predicted transglutaminase-like cysteine proteinase